ncbi:AAA family ATPase [Sandarakinorhabdus rubra]|uniref:AAA family ATPase n=1 Tax=Sandarakinorhabdus rubra TaxID=2672568 RepID=UPI0013DBD34D|nr:ATP-binding protein [Sandarakinorhabdus rubra]
MTEDGGAPGSGVPGSGFDAFETDVGSPLPTESELDAGEAARLSGRSAADWPMAALEPGPILPRFIASASDEIEGDLSSELARRRLLLRDALGASQPVTARETFAGRRDAMSTLIKAVEEQRVHVVVYGERGIGKTSLAHVFAETAREARYHVIYASCGTAANFGDMFRSVLARIPRIYHASVLPNSPEGEKAGSLEPMLPEGPYGARELAEVLAGLVGTRVLVILDEYDRVVDSNFRREVAELIKNLSDRAARVQLVITGVALNLDELIGYAPSIRRNIAGLPMSPLAPAEVRELLRMGERAAEIRYDKDSVALITRMAGGSPYLVRLLGHQAGLNALGNRRDDVNYSDTRTAVEKVIADWQASLPRRIQANLVREEARTHWPLLVAAARAGSTADGWFTVDDVVTELGGNATPIGVERDLKLFVNVIDLLERREGHGDPQFRFSYPGVSALLTMAAAMARQEA